MQRRAEVTRRRVLQAAVGLGGWLAARGAGAAAEASQAGPRVLGAFFYSPPRGGVGWPGPDFDAAALAARLSPVLQRYAADEGVTLQMEGRPLAGDEEVQRFAAKVEANRPQAVLLIPLQLGRWGALRRLVGRASATLIVAPVGACFSLDLQEFTQQAGVFAESTSDPQFGPVRFALRMVRTIGALGSLRVVLAQGELSMDRTLEPLSVAVRQVPETSFAAAWRAVRGAPEAAEQARTIAQQAVETAGPSEGDLAGLVESRMAIRRLMEETNSGGAAIACLSLLRSGAIDSPPCGGVSLLLDDAVPAACLRSANAAVSQAVAIHLLGRPGMQLRPLPDTETNTLVCAACSCPTRLRGFDVPPAPYRLVHQTESGNGAVLQVAWPAGQRVTLMLVDDSARMLVRRGEVTGSNVQPACPVCCNAVRVALDGVPDIRAVRGFHQLLLWGDHVRPLARFARFAGLQVEWM